MEAATAYGGADEGEAAGVEGEAGTGTDAAFGAVDLAVFDYLLLPELLITESADLGAELRLGEVQEVVEAHGGGESGRRLIGKDRTDMGWESKQVKYFE